jgi:hypothetical protein
VLIPADSSLEDTRQRVEQIRGLIKELKIRHGDQRLAPIAVSAGVPRRRNTAPPRLTYCARLTMPCMRPSRADATVVVVYSDAVIVRSA